MEFNASIFPKRLTLRFGNWLTCEHFSLRKERRLSIKFADCYENITSNKTLLHKSVMERKKPVLA